MLCDAMRVWALLSQDPVRNVKWRVVLTYDVAQLIMFVIVELTQQVVAGMRDSAKLECAEGGAAKQDAGTPLCFNEHLVLAWRMTCFAIDIAVLLLSRAHFCQTFIVRKSLS